jgi:hypothetical protein
VRSVTQTGLKRRAVSEEEASKILAAGDAEEEPSAVTLLDKERSVFRGKAVAFSGEANISLNELGAALRSGRLAEMAPWLLTLGGLVALLLLMAPLLWLTVDPLAGGGWFVLLLLTAVQAYRNRNKAN